MRRWSMRLTHARFTVTAGGLIFNDAGEILLLKHRFRAGSGWGLPGGFIEAGEQPIDALRRELMRQLERVRAQHEADVRRGAGWVALPTALARKYPAAGLELAWQYVFPASRCYVDSSTGQRRRHHLHESAIQREVTQAVRRAGLSKRATCHSFRHSFATHYSRTATTSARCRSYWDIGA